MSPDPATDGRGSPDGFDAAAYWRRRMTAAPDLTGTGTSGLPLAWQRSLYRAKRHAVERLLAERGVSVEGAAVLDHGCGTGYFEQVWEQHHARRVAGIDVVPELVTTLAERFPHRAYEAVDLAAPGGGTRLRDFDLVTAIDVLYHVVDDVALDRLLARLLDPAVARRWLLFTDDLRGGRPAPHVRFRPREEWDVRLRTHGFVVAGARPVYLVHNRHGRLDRRLPGLTGRARAFADRALLPVLPSRANMWVVLAERLGAARDR